MVIRSAITACLVLLSMAVQAQSLADWGYRLWIGPEAATIESAVNAISQGDQRAWLTYLSSEELDGREPNTSGFSKALEYVESRCQRWSLETKRQEVTYRRNDYDHNLLAWIKGSKSPDEIIVVGAHLDHLGDGNLGADDNGSGSVALMSVAEAISKLQPQRTICFQWYTAEESGLIGSRYYAANPIFPIDSPDIDNHIVMINMDMVGRFRFNDAAYALEPAIAAEIENRSPELSDYIKQLSTRYTFADSLTVTTGSRSDHASFRSYGIPVAWLFTGTHNDYHTPRDTVDKINFDGLTKVAKYCAELTWLCSENGHKSRLPAKSSIDTVRIGGEPYSNP